MFNYRGKGKELQRMAAKADAIDRSQAVIEFNLDGTIVAANENFLAAMGYSLDEIRGKHHSMFVEPAERDSAAYREFWARLNRGEFQAAQYKRIGKGGREIWIQASYNPILDGNGKPVKVVQVRHRHHRAEDREHGRRQGKIAAIDRAQAVIEFEMDGTIITANDNFLAAMGYALAEIQGKHHSMFVDAGRPRQRRLREFWAQLNRGEFQAGRVQAASARAARKSGSTRPTTRSSTTTGKPFKVVKFATDVTAAEDCKPPISTGRSRRSASRRR